MLNYSIRMLHDDEIRDALKLIKKVFDEFDANEYSNQGIDEFYRFIEFDSIIRNVRSEVLRFWGAFHDQQIIGVLAVRKIKHISLLFVDKNHHRQGIAKSLVNEAISYCIKENRGLEMLTVNSSPFGFESYKAMGFKQINTEQIVNGIRFIPMKYNV